GNETKRNPAIANNITPHSAVAKILIFIVEFAFLQTSGPSRFHILYIPMLKYTFVLGAKTLIYLTVKQIIATDRAPRAIGPYSQAVRAGNVIFASGQIPMDPATGEFV